MTRGKLLFMNLQNDLTLLRSFSLIAVGVLFAAMSCNIQSL